MSWMVRQVLKHWDTSLYCSIIATRSTACMQPGTAPPTWVKLQLLRRRRQPQRVLVELDHPAVQRYAG